MPGHAFISYVREDAAKVDRIQRLLDGAGIPVWRDRDSLWPGEDWKQRIRQAITDDALAFIACFSEASIARAKSGQNEELTLAIDQLRLRRPDQPWLIPVRFDDVDIPDFDIGGSRTLRSIQWVDLIGDDWDEGFGRLLRSVNRILADAGLEVKSGGDVRNAKSELERLKVLLRDPAGDIALHDMLMPVADKVHEMLADDSRFPISSERLRGARAEAAIWVADLVDEQVTTLDRILQFLVATASWAKQEHLRTLAQLVERILRARRDEGGMSVLTDLQWLPGVVLLYAGGLGALQYGNLLALRAIGIDARVRDRQYGLIPLIGRGNAWRAFQNFDLPTQVLAYRHSSDRDVTLEFVEQVATGRVGKRHTPISDFLHACLRRQLHHVTDDDDYDGLFDRWEVLLGVLMADLGLQATNPEDPYIDGPPFGRFTWQDRFGQGDGRLEVRVRNEFAAEGDRWPPIKAGLFGGSVDRAAAAFDDYIKDAERVRSNRW